MNAPPVAVTGLTFDDEFNRFTSSPDGSSGTWMTRYPFGGGASRTLPPNKEAEYYSDSSVGENPFSLSNGVLSLTATHAVPGSNPYKLPYDSGVITTYKSFAQQYGYFEMTAKLPSEQGLWPGFWLLPAHGNTVAELDILEQVGNHPTTIYSTTHGSTNGVDSGISKKLTVPNTATSFNTYGVDWEPTTVTYYVNGVKTASVPTPGTMNAPMYMLLNLAVGAAGSWPGAPNASTIFPASFQVDSVRAYSTANTVFVSGSAAACYAEGTRLMTDAGYVAIEDLSVGHLLVSARDGSARPIVWLGSRVVGAGEAAPVRVRAHAFGPGQPLRDVILSPDHAIHVDGVLIPARHLADGVCILSAPGACAIYWHVELAAHDVVLADGLPAESFLDAGQRGGFTGNGGVVVPHPANTSSVWEACGCVPLVVAGPLLASARSRLAKAAA